MVQSRISSYMFVVDKQFKFVIHFETILITSYMVLGVKIQTF